jgi:uncharacterized protein (DUF4415 family)
MRKKHTKKAASKAKLRARVDDMKALATTPDSDTDTSDIPEILDWSGAKRGLFYRPIKQQLTLRLDSDVVVHDDNYEGRLTTIRMTGKHITDRQVRRYMDSRKDGHTQPASGTGSRHGLKTGTRARR